MWRLQLLELGRWRRWLRDRHPSACGRANIKLWAWRTGGTRLGIAAEIVGAALPAALRRRDFLPATTTPLIVLTPTWRR
jgi:hypothetical protein